MHDKKQYPVLPEPPYAHAITVVDLENRLLTYEYNGRPTITISIPGNGIVDCRVSSDGDLMSNPLVQQHYVIVSEPVIGTVTFHLSNDTINIRPARAGHEQAILGQVGRPLMFGINGFYDINQDLLIDWHGAEWKWLGIRLESDGSGDLTAKMQVELGPSPWIINMKMHYYNKHLGFSYHKPWKWRPKVEPISGWCSWEAYRREVTEEKIQKAAEFVNDNFKAYGMKYIQLDDGFQPSRIPSSIDRSVADDWLSTNSNFPAGHKGNVDAITRYGLEAGIWIYTYVHNEEYAKVNPGFIRDKDNEPIEGDWIGFIVDCLPDTLKRYVSPSFEGFRKYGYTYLKTDGLRHLIYDGLHEAVRRGLLTNDEAELRFRRYVEYIREALGPDIFYLSSWGVMSQMVGVADACRIGTDVNPSWPNIRMQMIETARWFHTQRILFLNDPDHLCIRAKYEWSQSAISLVSLSGGLFMLSDAPEEYDQGRISMIKKNLPPLKTYAGETGIPYTDMQAYTWTKAHGAAYTAGREEGIKKNEVTIGKLVTAAGKYPTIDDTHPFSTLWAFHIDTPARSWCVAGRFATAPLEKSELYFENLGLDPGLGYLVFDFWAQEYLGKFYEKLPCRELELGCCQILALCPETGHPQFLASTRHVSMDAVSVKSQKWDGHILTLELAGVPETTETYRIHVPGGYLPGNFRVNGEPVLYILDGEVLSIDICFKIEKAIIKLDFTTLLHS